MSWKPNYTVPMLPDEAFNLSNGTSRDPYYEPLYSDDFQPFKGGTTLLLPLILFFIQVALLFVMCYQSYEEESLIRRESVLARMSVVSNTKTNNVNNNNTNKNKASSSASS